MSIFVFLCYLFEIISSEPLILQFSTRNPIDSTNVMNSLITNYIYTNFIVGSNKQQMEMCVRTYDSSTFLVSDSCKDNTLAVKFSASESESYSAKSSIKFHLMYEYSAASSTDDFIILQTNNNQIEIKDYEFMLVSSLWDSYQEYFGGMIGLQFQKKRS